MHQSDPMRHCLLTHSTADLRDVELDSGAIIALRSDIARAAECFSLSPPDWLLLASHIGLENSVLSRDHYDYAGVALNAKSVPQVFSGTVTIDEILASDFPSLEDLVSISFAWVGNDFVDELDLDGTLSERLCRFASTRIENVIDEKLRDSLSSERLYLAAETAILLKRHLTPSYLLTLADRQDDSFVRLPLIALGSTPKDAASSIIEIITELDPQKIRWESPSIARACDLLPLETSLDVIRFYLRKVPSRFRAHCATEVLRLRYRDGVLLLLLELLEEQDARELDYPEYCGLGPSEASASTFQASEWFGSWGAIAYGCDADPRMIIGWAQSGRPTLVRVALGYAMQCCCMYQDITSPIAKTRQQPVDRVQIVNLLEALTRTDVLQSDTMLKNAFYELEKSLG